MAASDAGACVDSANHLHERGEALEQQGASDACGGVEVGAGLHALLEIHGLLVEGVVLAQREPQLSQRGGVLGGTLINQLDEELS